MTETLKDKAEAIFGYHWRKREKAILAHRPKNEQWMLRQYIENIGKAREIKAGQRGSGRHEWSRYPVCNRGSNGNQ